MWFKGSIIRSALLHSEAKSSANVRSHLARGAQGTCFQWHYWKYTTESGNRIFSPRVSSLRLSSPSIKRQPYTKGCQPTVMLANDSAGGGERKDGNTDHAPGTTLGTCSHWATDATGVWTVLLKVNKWREENPNNQKPLLLAVLGEKKMNLTYWTPHLTPAPSYQMTSTNDHLSLCLSELFCCSCCVWCQ